MMSATTRSLRRRRSRTAKCIWPPSQSTAGLRAAAAGYSGGDLDLANVGTNFGWNESDDYGKWVSVRGSGELRGKCRDEHDGCKRHLCYRHRQPELWT